MEVLRLGMVAAEASGDLLGAELLDALRARWPDLVVSGIGGARMRAQGADSWWPIEKLSVRGFAEVLPRLPELLWIRRQLGQRLLRERPALFIGVDAPDFNFALEHRLRMAGIKTVHFISPSFWAWRTGRLRALKAAADRVLCLFPFEPDLLAAAGIDASYVGHPLAQSIPMVPDRGAARAALGLPEHGPLLALLPGSRAAEIDAIAPRFLAAAQILARQRPHLSFVLPTLDWLQPRIEAVARRSGCAAALGARLRILPDASHEALAACDVALVASGTATLEAALYKRPMVIAYAMPGLSYAWMRRQRRLPWVGLPNILCAPFELLRTGAPVEDAPFVVPELLQDAATPQALAGAVQAWLDDPEHMARVEQRFVQLHEELRLPTAQRAADAIEIVLER